MHFNNYGISDINIYVQIQKINLGVPCKDLSKAEINGLKIKSTKIGLAAFRKKEEFGPAKICIKNLTLEETLTSYLLEENSHITKDKISYQVNKSQPAGPFFTPRIRVDGPKMLCLGHSGDR